MRRLGLILSGVLVAAFFSPVTAQAAVIQCYVGDPAPCEVIGEFTWSRDDASFGDIFGVNNLSDLSSIPGDFSSLSVLIDNTTSASFLDDPLPAGSTTETFDSLSGVTSALLSFSFHGTVFSVGLSDADLVPDTATDTFFASTLIYAQSVPEPSSLLLLGTALAAGRWARRRKARALK